MTLNLYEGGVLMDSVLDFLEQEQPDILVAQEALQSDDPSAPLQFQSIEQIQSRMHFAACEYAPSHIDATYEYKPKVGNATFSRFPILEHHLILYGEPFGERTERTHKAFSMTPHNLQHTVIDVDGVSFNVLNTQGVWDLDGDNPSEARKQMCQLIADTARGLEHVLFAADSNLKPTNAALEPMDETLHSVFGHELKTSFNIKRKDMEKFPGYGTAVVDLMYVSHDIRVVEHYCPDVDVSDHLPLVAIIEPYKSNKGE
jgi:endonuclease/exonuclease/phosphatase family metal-dependent hydrolase